MGLWDRITWALGMGAHCYGCFPPTVWDYLGVGLCVVIAFVGLMAAIETYRGRSRDKDRAAFEVHPRGTAVTMIIGGAVFVIFLWLIGTYGNPLGD